MCSTNPADVIFPQFSLSHNTIGPLCPSVIAPQIIVKCGLANLGLRQSERYSSPGLRVTKSLFWGP